MDADAPTQARLLGEEFPRLMFLLLPVFALLLKVVFRDRLYFDHLIYSLHLHSAAYVILAVMVPLDGIADRHWLPLIVQLASLYYLLSYVILSLRRVYGVRPGRAATVGIGVLVVYVILMAISIDVSQRLGSVLS
jgi:hypothetical protein